MTYKVGYIVGSISAESINRRLAEALVSVAPENLEMVELLIAQLPFYNRDLDGDYPQAGKDFKAAIEACDAILFITPEYSRSLPGVLKNAMDMASRPWGTNSFAGKPGAVIGMSPGGIGTAVAQNHLRAILGHLDVITMGQPEAYVEYREGMLNADNTVADPTSKAMLSGYMLAFADHIQMVLERDAALVG